MATIWSKRDVLLGVCAVQCQLITQEQLIKALDEPRLSASSSIGAILVQQGALQEADISVLEQLVNRQIEAHGGDPVRSLVALSSLSELHESIVALAESTTEDTDDRAGLSTISVQQKSKGTESGSFETAGRPVTGQRFRVLNQHASGGLGDVFVAQDLELGRRVALKEIQRRHLESENHRARFIQEAEINGNLEHPGIVPVYGLGVYQDGRPYYAMRLIEGETLKEAVARFHEQSPSLDPTSYILQLRGLLRRFIDICNAIAYAHSRGILHRDLKPSNVMLGQYGETLLIDWGLAKPLGKPGADSGLSDTSTEDSATFVPTSGSDLDPTQAGAILGTASYMSPEQAEGRLDDLGPATDVYGLGGILYTILTNAPPVKRSNRRDTLLKVRKGEITSPKVLAPRVPPALGAIALKALALKPEERYSNPSELALEVEQFLNDEPVLAYPDPLYVRLWRWVRKHRTLATTALAIVLIGLIALTIIWRREANYAKERAAYALDLEEANALADDRLDLAMQSIEDYYSGVSAEVLSQGQLSEQLRESLLEKPQQFYEQLTQEIESKQNVSDRERYLLAQGQMGLAETLRILGRLAESRAQSLAAIENFGRLLEKTPESVDYLIGQAKSRNNLGIVLARLDQPAEAVPVFRATVEGFQKTLELDPENIEAQKGIATGLSNLGEALRKTNQPREAIESIETSIARFEELRQEDPASVDYREGLARSLSNLGAVLLTSGRFSEATDFLRRSVGLYERLVEDRPEVIGYQSDLSNGLGNLATAFFVNQEFDQALARIKQAVQLSASLAELQPKFVNSWDRLARSAAMLGIIAKDLNRTTEGIIASRRSIEAFEALIRLQPEIPRHRVRLALTRFTLGELLHDAEDFDEAAESFRSSAEMYRDLIVRGIESAESRLNCSLSLGELAACLRELGRVEEAVEVERSRVVLWEDNPVELYRAAGQLALCIPLIPEAETGSSLSRIAVANEVMEILSRAVELGWSDGSRLAGDPRLAPLQNRADLEALANELMDQSFPGNVFAGDP